MQTYNRTRGRELPGNYNHALLAELFHAQSERWGNIAHGHVYAVARLVSRFMQSALTSVVNDKLVQENLLQNVNDRLEENVRAAFEELNKLLQDEAGSPITYNHYYTDNIQKSRNDRAKKHLHKSMENAIDEDWNGRFHISNSSDDINKLFASLQTRVTFDMEEQACNDAQNDLGAYYKVRSSRQTLINYVMLTVT